jgi:hypothetical protein
VRGQFVYELQGCYYYNPDVIGDFTNVFVKQIGSSHVQIGGARGEKLPQGFNLPLCQDLTNAQIDRLAGSGDVEDSTHVHWWLPGGIFCLRDWTSS